MARSQHSQTIFLTSCCLWASHQGLLLKGTVQGLGSMKMAGVWFLEDLQQCTRMYNSIFDLGHGVGWRAGGRLGSRAFSSRLLGSCTPGGRGIIVQLEPCSTEPGPESVSAPPAEGSSGFLQWLIF